MAASGSTDASAWELVRSPGELSETPDVNSPRELYSQTPSPQSEPQEEAEGPLPDFAPPGVFNAFIGSQSESGPQTPSSLFEAYEAAEAEGHQSAAASPADFSMLSPAMQFPAMPSAQMMPGWQGFPAQQQQRQTQESRRRRKGKKERQLERVLKTRDLAHLRTCFQAWQEASFTAQLRLCDSGAAAAAQTEIQGHQIEGALLGLQKLGAAETLLRNTAKLGVVFTFLVLALLGLLYVSQSRDSVRMFQACKEEMRLQIQKEERLQWEVAELQTDLNETAVALKQSRNDFNHKVKEVESLKAELLNAEKTFADRTETHHTVMNSLLDRLRENEHALSQSEQRNKQMHLQLDGKTYALDQAVATIELLKEELAARAEETDAQGKKTRKAQRELLDTLHHGLQWMWKSQGLAKQSKKLRELLRAARNSGLFKDAEIERLREELDKLGEHKDSSKVPGFITNLLGLFMSSALRGRKSV